MDDTQKAPDIVKKLEDDLADQVPEEPRPTVDLTPPTPQMNESMDDIQSSKINGAQPAPGSIFPSQDFTNPYIALVPKIRERSKSKELAAGSTLDDLVQQSEQELQKIEDAKVQKEPMPDFEFLKYHKTQETENSARALQNELQKQMEQQQLQDPSQSDNSNDQGDSSNGQQTKSDASNQIRKNILEGDKLKNLKSVLQTRKPTKNSSAQRHTAAVGERRQSYGQYNRAPMPRNVGASPMNLQNQRLLRQRKNSGNNKGVHQSYDVSNTFGGISGLLKRPASQSSKTSGKGSNNGGRRPPTAKQQKNAMISLTAGGGTTSGGRGSRKMLPTGKIQKETPNETPQPDNDYLETMKQRMKGLPVNTSKQLGINKTWMNNQPFDGTKTQDIMSKTIESMVSPKASNTNMGESPNEKLSSSAKVTGNQQSYSLRAMKRKESVTNSANKKSSTANSYATLPVDFDNQVTFDPSRGFNTSKPKNLASKQANLMRATKSSAMRNNLVGQITTKYQTTTSQMFDTNALQSSPPKRAATGKSKGRTMKTSPNRGGSPLNKSKSLAQINQRGVINLRQAEQQFIDHQEYPGDINNINFYAVQEGENIQNVDQLEYQPDDTAEPLTLEGISGMVLMDSSDGLRKQNQMKLDASDDNIVCDDDIDKDLKGGESATSAGRSEEEIEGSALFNKDALSPKKINSQTVPGQKFKPLDIQTISIDSDNLDELSKKANVEEIQLSQRVKEERTQKNSEFDSEIMSIIGSINSRAQLLRKKILPKKEETAVPDAEQTIVHDDPTEPLDISRSSSLNFEATQQDPLKDISIDMKDEVDLMDDDDKDAEKEPKYTTNLDQTIIIGEMDDGTESMFDELKLQTQRTDQSHVSQMIDLKNADKNKDDEDIITISKVDLQNMVDNLKIRHRAELDACLIEQGVYKKIISQMVQKFKQQERQINLQHFKILGLQKYELQAQKYLELNTKLSTDCKFYQSQVDKLKISLIEFDRHMREKVLTDNEFIIQQLETENAHLRKLLNIPEELFKIDPEEEKKKEAEKKRNMLKSIDDKLKRAEQKIQKKQTAADIYYQNQKEHGIDPFELDQEDYDMFRMSKLKDQGEMAPEVKEKLEKKIYGRMQERSMQEEMRRQHEKDILEEFARVYGYDVNKHQPHNNNGEIDVEYLQAYIAECRAQEEKMAKEKALAKQKEALKGKVGGSTAVKPKQSPPATNNTGTKSSVQSVKKNLTLETDNFLKDEKDGEKSAEKKQEEDDDDDFGRDDDSKPMTKEELEKESSNSVGSLQRIGENEGEGENMMTKTLSSSKLQGLFDQEDSGKFEEKPASDPLDQTIKSVDSGKSIGSNDAIVVEDQNEQKAESKDDAHQESTETSDSKEEAKQDQKEKVEEPSTFVDDEEIDERDDLEDDEEGDEIDEQTKKDLANLNASDESEKLKDISLEKQDSKESSQDSNSMDFEDKDKDSDEDDVVKDEQKEILASSSNKTPSDQFTYSSSSSGQGQPVTDPYNSQFGSTLQGSIKEDGGAMSMTLKGNAGNIFGISNDDKVKIDDQLEDKDEREDTIDEEEERLLGTSAPTDKYNDFDDLEDDDDDDFNDYDKNNVDHEKPKFNETDNADDEKEKAIENVNKEKDDEQPKMEKSDTDKN